jgi:Carboxypeptidase regulatory-like domain
MRRVLIFISVFLLALVTVRRVSAGPRAKARCTLTGVVLGPDDKPVPHAAVSYQSSGGSAPHAVHTDSSGRFRISNLKTDDYDVRASAHGVFSEWVKNLSVRPGQTREVTLRLIYARKMPKWPTKSKPKS